MTLYSNYTQTRNDERKLWKESVEEYERKLLFMEKENAMMDFKLRTLEQTSRIKPATKKIDFSKLVGNLDSIDSNTFDEMEDVASLQANLKMAVQQLRQKVL